MNPIHFAQDVEIMYNTFINYILKPFVLVWIMVTSIGASLIVLYLSFGMLVRALVGVMGDF